MLNSASFSASNGEDTILSLLLQLRPVFLSSTRVADAWAMMCPPIGTELGPLLNITEPPTFATTCTCVCGMTVVEDICTVAYQAKPKLCVLTSAAAGSVRIRYITHSQNKRLHLNWQ